MNSFKGALIVAAMAYATAASAVTIVDGTVSGPDGSWGFVDFQHHGGSLSIDAWANGFTAGPTGQGIDDIYLTLLSNDGSSRSAFTGALIATNDDSSGQADGSTSGLDSYLNLGSLSSGSYTLAISHCCSSFANTRNESLLTSGIHGTSRDYRVTFDGNVEISSVPIVTPSPRVIVNGTVAGPNGSWGFVEFEHRGGRLEIDALAHGFSAGPTGQGIDDIFLSVFQNDGSPLSAFTGAFIGANDDSNGFTDGSASTLDSYLNLEGVAAGSYLVAISHCCNGFNGVRNEDLLVSGIHDNLRDYRLTFGPNVTSASVVPEPQGYALFIAGVGLVLARLRRNNKA